MEIYIKKEGVLKETNLVGLIKKSLIDSDISCEYGSFGDGSGCWLRVTEEFEDKLIETFINFDSNDKNRIESIDTYKTPIERIAVEEKTEKINQ